MPMPELEPGQFRLNFGGLGAPLNKQLKAFGLKLPPDDLRHLQADADAVLRAKVRGYMTDKAADAARQRLMKRITAAK